MKMYEDYLKEKYENRKVIVLEDKGFIEYEMYEDGSCFIWTLYTKPDLRGEGHGYGLEKLMINKEKPSAITCSVDLKAKNPELSLRKILGVGYKIDTVTSKQIILTKVMNYGNREREEKEV